MQNFVSTEPAKEIYKDVGPNIIENVQFVANRLFKKLLTHPFGVMVKYEP